MRFCFFVFFFFSPLSFHPTSRSMFISFRCMYPFTFILCVGGSRGHVSYQTGRLLCRSFRPSYPVHRACFVVFIVLYENENSPRANASSVLDLLVDHNNLIVFLWRISEFSSDVDKYSTQTSLDCEFRTSAWCLMLGCLEYQRANVCPVLLFRVSLKPSNQMLNVFAIIMRLP